MGKGSFRALVAAGALVPILIAMAVLLHPRGRAFVTAFFAPLPDAVRDAKTVALPPLGGLRGAESVELRTLREDASAQAGRANTVVRPRSLLFGLNPAGEIPADGDPFVRPSGLRRPDIVLRDGKSVDQAIQHLTKDPAARARFVEALKRSGRFAPDISRILHAWKVPDALIAVAFVESAFQPTAASSDNAVGLWQLPPDVAHVYGLSMLPAYDERRGINSGTEAAARYLADLRERLGSWELTFVAFAIGYKRTLDVLTTQGSTDFWELAPAFPRTANAYVAEVMGTSVLLENLDRFGLDTVRRADAASVSDLDVRGATPLALVARAAGISVPALQELNPEYSSDMVPTTTFPMLVHIPSGALARARELLPLLLEGKDVDVVGGNAPEADKAPSRVLSRGTDKRMFYRVREGDTLPSLAREYAVSLETLSSDNALDSTSSLRPGMILAIRLDSQTPDAATKTSETRPKR